MFNLAVNMVTGLQQTIKGHIVLIRLALVGLLVVSGCASSTYHATNYCGAPTSNVKVLNQPPSEGTYIVCGSIQLEAGGLATDSTVLESIKQEAGKRGANAVLLIDDVGAKFTIKFGYTRQGTILAIRTK